VNTNVLTFPPADQHSPGKAENAGIAAIADNGKRRTLSCLHRPALNAFGASETLLMYFLRSTETRTDSIVRQRVVRKTAFLNRCQAAAGAKITKTMKERAKANQCKREIGHNRYA
jgi:hypothetical protein